MTDAKQRHPGAAPAHGPEVVEERRGRDPGGDDRSMEPDAMTLEDVIDAEGARPDLPGETADGLDDMDEEVRRQAEDLPLDTSGRA